MMFEVAGFAAGVLGVAAFGWALIRHERYRLIRGIYGSRTSAGRGGNALIWPSR